MSTNIERTRWVLMILAAALLFFGLYLVFKPFLSVFAWSAIVVLTTWPLYLRLSSYLPDRPAISAFLMTFLLGALLLLVFIPILRAVSSEFESAVSKSKLLLEESKFQEIVQTADRIPIIGHKIAEIARTIRRDGVDSSIDSNGEQIIGMVTVAAKSLAQFVTKFLMFIFVIFFVYRDGKSLALQLRRALFRLGGARLDHLLHTTRETLAAVVYGLLLTALAQGLMAGLGFWAAGAPLPLLFGAATVVASLFPFGAPLLYIPIILMLATSGASWVSVIGLALWCVLVVSTIDNVLRPIFIGQRTNLSVLLVFIGVIGGTVSFGLLGVFLGPIIIALTKILWDEWIGQAPAHVAPAGR